MKYSRFLFVFIISILTSCTLVAEKQDIDPAMQARLNARLTAQQLYIVENLDTERPFTYDLPVYEPGEYRCIRCGEVLFRSGIILTQVQGGLSLTKQQLELSQQGLTLVLSTSQFFENQSQQETAEMVIELLEDAEYDVQTEPRYLSFCSISFVINERSDSSFSMRSFLSSIVDSSMFKRFSSSSTFFMASLFRPLFFLDR
ncbi:MAG: peptide-methionine (R)-S-oxide reductase [Spirochaetia bacterium]